jgi:hypothetical protein
MIPSVAFRVGGSDCTEQPVFHVMSGVVWGSFWSLDMTQPVSDGLNSLED